MSELSYDHTDDVPELGKKCVYLRIEVPGNRGAGVGRKVIEKGDLDDPWFVDEFSRECLDLLRQVYAKVEAVAAEEYEVVETTAADWFDE